MKIETNKLGTKTMILTYDDLKNYIMETIKYLPISFSFHYRLISKCYYGMIRIIQKNDCNDIILTRKDGKIIEINNYAQLETEIEFEFNKILDEYFKFVKIKST